MNYIYFCYTKTVKLKKVTDGPFENTRFVLGHYINYLKFRHFRKMLLINVAQNMGFPLRNGLRMTFLAKKNFQFSMWLYIEF